jgi:HAD superfamily hydrolase (TIGR01509 family)
MIKALIFDFDGVVLDTEGPSYAAWREVYAQYDFTLDFDEWVNAVGSRKYTDYQVELSELLGRPVELDEIVPIYLGYITDLLNQLPVMPGVEAYIAAAETLGLKLAVASGSACQRVYDQLKRLGLFEHFESIKCRDDVPQIKPDPALYNLTLDVLGVAPDEALTLEDTPNGVLAAKRAGIYCVAVPNEVTRRLNFDRADLRIESLTEMSLEDVLKQLAN